MFVVLQCPSSVEEWVAVAKEFYDLWNFPLCLGALDGKHIAIRKPTGSGSKFYNYKHFCSVILLAVCDANYKFLFIDIGSQGQCSDGGVFRESDLKEAIERNLLNIPDNDNLPGTNTKFPYCLIADEGFPLRDYLMKPFPHRKLPKPQKIYNYRVSRARRCVESGFGIMANRFRVFLNPICLSPTKVDCIVQACCSLHNMLRTIAPTRYTVVDDNTNVLAQPSGAIMQPARVSSRRSASQSAKRYRDILCDYFNGIGAVEWQDKMI